MVNNYFKKLIAREVAGLEKMPNDERLILIETLELWADDDNPVSVAGKYLESAFNYITDHPDMTSARQKFLG